MSLIKDVSDKVWFNRHRANTLADMVLDADIREKLEGYVKSGELPHLLLAGPPGIGKSTLAGTLINEFKADHIFINASAERGIDVIRQKISNYCSTMSLDGELKVVWLDEADRLTPEAQDALRPVMEAFSKHVVFFMTCNHPDRIAEAIKSRAKFIDLVPKDKKAAATAICKLSARILKDEGVEFENAAIVQIVKYFYPDMRSIINELQDAAASGKVDMASVSNAKATSFEGLFEIIEARKFPDMLTWVYENVKDPEGFIINMWRESSERLELSTVPNACLAINDAQRYISAVPDKLLSICAMLTTLMQECKVKPKESEK